eukprot:Hpha_TRINITY_DN15702_c7_g1::TRINITY_DN15702_c7_g1_i2::g.37930::m.37930
MPDPELAHERRGAHWTFDSRSFANACARLKATPEPLRLPSFDHSRGDPVADDLRVGSEKIVILEGLYLFFTGEPFWSRACSLLDLRVFVDLPQSEATERLTLRHMKAWGISRQKAGERAGGSDYLNAQLVASTRVAADVVLRPSGELERRRQSKL